MTILGSWIRAMAKAKKSTATPSEQSVALNAIQPAKVGLLADLGLLALPPRDPWAEEEFPADRELLRRFIKDELSPDQVRYVSGMLAKYRHWHDAWGKLLFS